MLELKKGRAGGWLATLGFCGAVLASVIVGCSGDDVTDTSACLAGATMCGGRCTPLSSDPENCGGCGNACSEKQICDLGACTLGLGDAAPRDATAGDAHADASHDAGADTLADAASEASTEASIDGSADAATDASTGVDAAPDAVSEAATDGPDDVAHPIDAPEDAVDSGG